MGEAGDLIREIRTRRSGQDLEWFKAKIHSAAGDCPEPSLSHLSNIETGKALLKRGDSLLRCIALALGIPEETLIAAVEKDRKVAVKRASGYSIQYLISQADRGLQHSLEFLWTGRPLMAREDLDFLIFDFLLRLTLDEVANSIAVNEARLALGALFTRRMWVQHALLPKDLVLRHTIPDYREAMKYIRKARAIAKNNKDLERTTALLETEAISLLGDSYYIASRWKTGERLAKRAATSEIADLTVRQRSFRAWMLCSSRIRRGNIIEPQAYCTALIDKELKTDNRDNVRTRITLWESIGRVNILLAQESILSSDVYKALQAAKFYLILADEARKFSLRTYFDPLPSYEFQIIRAHLMAAVVARRKGVSFGVDDVGRWAKRGFELARGGNYIRYWFQTKEFVEKLGIENDYLDELNNPLVIQLKR